MPFTVISERLNRREAAVFWKRHISTTSRAIMKHMVQTGSYVGQNALFLRSALRQFIEYKGSDCKSKRAAPIAPS